MERHYIDEPPHARIQITAINVVGSLKCMPTLAVGQCGTRAARFPLFLITQFGGK